VGLVVKSEKNVCHSIDEAIQILRKHFPEQLLLFSESQLKKIPNLENRTYILREGKAYLIY